MNEFLRRTGWALEHPVSQDVSPRRYFRVSKNGRTALLMDASAVEDKDEIHDFVRIARWLNDVGIKAPDIYEEDTAGGYLLLEDFGDVSFGGALSHENCGALYGLAHDILQHLAGQECPLDLPSFFDSKIYKGHEQVMAWYAPLVRSDSEDLSESYRGVWQQIEKDLPKCPQGFIHGDYHAENLMWIPGNSGLNRLGVIDFQSALYGPVPYDLGNLLEDARREIPAEVKRDVLRAYDEDFLAWYRVLTTQFHCRVIGLFIKLAQEKGRTAYLVHVPRLQNYISSALEEPLLEPLKMFFAHEKISFDSPLDFSALDRPKTARG